MGLGGMVASSVWNRLKLRCVGKTKCRYRPIHRPYEPGVQGRGLAWHPPQMVYESLMVDTTGDQGLTQASGVPGTGPGCVSWPPRAHARPGSARSELLPLSIYHFPLLAFTLKADTASFWIKRAETLRLSGATGIVVKVRTGTGRQGF